MFCRVIQFSNRKEIGGIWKITCIAGRESQSTFGGKGAMDLGLSPGYGLAVAVTSLR